MALAYPPRKVHSVEPLLRLSGLEPLNYKPNEQNMRDSFLMIGERCNVAGSIIYKKAIVHGDYDKAVGIALSQVSVQHCFSSQHQRDVCHCSNKEVAGCTANLFTSYLLPL